MFFGNIVSLASSLVATACINIINTAIVFVHNSFIKQFIKVLQLDKSLFKYHSNSSKHGFKCHNGSKTESNTKLNTENSWGSFTANWF